MNSTDVPGWVKAFAIAAAIFTLAFGALHVAGVAGPSSHQHAPGEAGEK